jgi:predicted nucleotidyltransferase
MKPSDVLDSYRRELRQLVCRLGLARVRIFGLVLTGTDAEQSDVALHELRPVVYAHLHALDFTLDEATPLIGRLAEIDHRIAAARSHG